MAIANLILPLMILGVFYFFIIRPQQTLRKQQQDFVDSLEKGKEVVTSGGIIGRINKIEDNVVTLQIDPKTFIRVARAHISKELTEAIAKGEDVQS